jgi:Mce-associated membrane protein
MALVLVALLVVSVVAGVLLWQRNADLSERQEVLTAERDATREASRIAVSMTSYDHRTVEEDFAWIEDDGTADFQDTFSESTEPIRKLIVRTGATATGKVSDAAGTAEDADHVEVLLFVDQQLKREGDSRPTVDSNRVVMQMVREDGRWLVDDVELR